MPATFGSTILLPADYINWDAAKRRAVLFHEKSHVERRDFVLLMLASLHCAVFWFKPLSWGLKRRIAEPAEIISDDAAVAPGPVRIVVTPAAQIPPTCGLFMDRLRNPDRQPSLEPLPTPCFQRHQSPGFANPVTQVVYDWPDGITKTGVLSCFDGEFVLYRMRADTAARRQQNGSEPCNSRDLAIITAAIFAYTGTPPRTTVQLLLPRQPRRPGDDDVTSPLFGGSHMLWLQYDSFAIS